MSELLDKLDDLGAETEDSIERFMNDEEMYLKYVHSFPDEPTMKKLTKSVEEKNYEQAEKDVHALKGIVNNLGFLPLADATIDMLAELREKNIPEALDAFECLQKEYKKFCDVICEYKNE